MTAPFSFKSYATSLAEVMLQFDWEQLAPIAEAILARWASGKRVFLCGNGGSAANATHLANDFIYGVAPKGPAIRAISLTDNASIITCLANDTSYDNIFAHQLLTQGEPGDLLLAFSGSGNSPNIVAAMETARKMGIGTAAVLGFSGGRCKQLADLPLHFPLYDMQMAEDLQQTIGHMLTLWLRQHAPLTHA